ncbi:MAG: hypothetical protein COU08_00900 [Candidatus Harrisonbacteria bacterium CG10_big_fil_rev_8_21_14_0_10_42_17]|uniref:Uncharacterized protein n=1 Tax=Candidatus Harrisonbacteria bacterium CG10_big_fil_rev_8_21_14_0_10_42_17 TaxID=1974584 RepID=A0A2M6WIV8_9BACT|nr:MAG: hypothetical protein COU08_00900 [Candidatus Harrisonbacteria bacterium CG10_big_fil_rev_8_21_14_0_10_42_17]
MNHISKEKIEELKALLTKTKSELKEEIESLEKTPEMGNDVNSGDEETDETSAFGAQLGMEMPIKDRLARVEEALRKMEDGSYGICEKCSGNIEGEILDIDPESELCKECKLKLRG